jgi:hypothetical protein
MNGAIVVLVVIILLCSGALGFFIINLLKKKDLPSPTYAPSQGISPRIRADSANGNYGVCTYLCHADAVQKNVGDMLKLNVRDFMLYDWAYNYSGIFQCYEAPTATDNLGHPPPNPNWWTQETNWNDPISYTGGGNLISKCGIRAAINAIHNAGGKAYAYINAQLSEYGNLGGAFPGATLDECGTKIDTETVCASSKSPPILTFPDDDIRYGHGICKYMRDRKWKYATLESRRVLYQYQLGSKLAWYQCNAWYPILEYYGFDGVHWDVSDLDKNNSDEKQGIEDFMRTAKILLGSKGLVQTFNNVDMNVDFDDSFYSGPDPIFSFPYSEVWNKGSEADVLALASKFPGTCMARYTDGPWPSDEACCINEPTDNAHSKPKCEGGVLPKCQPPSYQQYGYVKISVPNKPRSSLSCECFDPDQKNINGGPPLEYSQCWAGYPCPLSKTGAPMTQAELAEYRWDKYMKSGVRYVLIANGENRITWDYWPDTQPILTPLKNVILNNSYPIFKTSANVLKDTQLSPSCFAPNLPQCFAAPAAFRRSSVYE